MVQSYIGRVHDFSNQALTGLSARVKITATTVATSGEFKTELHTTKPIYVATNPSTGWFSVDLVPSGETFPETFYQLEVEWLDPEAGYVGWDEFPWVFYADHDGGNIGSMLQMPSSFGQIWLSTSSVLVPPLAKVEDLVFNISNGDILRVRP